MKHDWDKNGGGGSLHALTAGRTVSLEELGGKNNPLHTVTCSRLEKHLIHIICLNVRKDIFIFESCIKAAQGTVLIVSFT